ncbi:MAG TPA: hypothetical protein DDY13_18600 [Cytophagales bacterium]|nr:hypothetical protein [Cytophagales bacterium]
MTAIFAFYTSKGGVCGIFRNFIDGWEIDHNVISSLFIFQADYEGINLIFLIPVMVQAQNTTLSFFEVIDTETGKRNVVWQDKDLIEAPNWMPDGRFLVNSKGSIYTIDTTQQQKKLINTGFAQRCNNDHGISPNGKWLAISHYDMDARYDTARLTSKIYILPIEGGKPRLVT